MKPLVALLLTALLAACANNDGNQVTTHLNGFYSTGFTGISK